MIPDGDDASTEPGGIASATSEPIRHALRSSSAKSGFAALRVCAVIAGLAAPSTVTAIDSEAGILTLLAGGDSGHTFASC